MPGVTDVVTGSFGYIGRYITAQLLQAGRQVKTITSHVDKPNPFGSNVDAFPYDFDRPERLIETLRVVDTLYNTYWIRSNHGGLTFEQAVGNTEILFRCAASADVRKIVHISVIQASPDSPLPYYAGKGLQEQAAKESGVPYAIVRPTLVFGKEDILVNNIAWLMRNFPVFPIAGDGQYRLQPNYVGDLASIAINQAAGADSETIDAIGTETYTFQEFTQSISSAIGGNVALVRVPPGTSIFLGKAIGLFLRDVILTGDELKGLMDNHLTSSQKPNAPTKFSEWLKENRQTVGSAYSSELDRHFRWSSLK
jgi:NADH dehydrogenase